MNCHRLSAVLAVTAVPIAVVAIAACGGSSHAATTPSAPPKTSGGTDATIGLANTALGQILVDSQGRTLYLFKADTGAKSTCFGACAAAWPPLRAGGTPTGGPGTNASLIGTTARWDGQRQVTYNAHPLYLYAGDQQPGQTNGQGITGFGAAWFALSAAGRQVSGSAMTASGGSSSAAAAAAYAFRPQEIPQLVHAVGKRHLES
ncbi:MAG: COG4315 family predicted lipoprotein [Solirubrobacteraceae bacterium]